MAIVKNFNVINMVVEGDQKEPRLAYLIKLTPPNSHVIKKVKFNQTDEGFLDVDIPEEAAESLFYTVVVAQGDKIVEKYIEHLNQPPVITPAKDWREA